MTASPAETKADPYKDLSADQKARVERALAKATAKETVPQEDPITEAKTTEEHANDVHAEANGTAVEVVAEPEIEGEVIGEVARRTDPIRRSRAAKGELRKQNMHYQVCEPLAADDMEALRTSVLANGIMVPVIIDQDGMVLDGHNRVTIAVDNDLPIPTVVVDLETDAEKRTLAWELNRARRQMTAAQKSEIRWQAVVVEGRPVAEVAKELGETPETVLRNVRKDAERHQAESSTDGDADETPTPVEVLTPKEQQRRKIVDAHKLSPTATDAAIAKETGAPKATVNRIRKTLKVTGDEKATVKNKTAPKPTIHDDFSKAVGKLSKAADELVRLAGDQRANRSGPKLWETNGQELVAILNKLSEVSGKLGGKK